MERGRWPVVSWTRNRIRKRKLTYLRSHDTGVYSREHVKGESGSFTSTRLTLTDEISRTESQLSSGRACGSYVRVVKKHRKSLLLNLGWSLEFSGVDTFEKIGMAGPSVSMYSPTSSTDIGSLSKSLIEYKGELGSAC